MRYCGVLMYFVANRLRGDRYDHGDCDFTSNDSIECLLILCWRHSMLNIATSSEARQFHSVICAKRGCLGNVPLSMYPLHNHCGNANGRPCRHRGSCNTVSEKHESLSCGKAIFATRRQLENMKRTDDDTIRPFMLS